VDCLAIRFILFLARARYQILHNRAAVTLSGAAADVREPPQSLEFDPLLHREGGLRNQLQAVANTLFTMRSSRQPVATHRNGFGLILRISEVPHLRRVATGCNHGAP
jgi:hypothetical protein